MINLHPYEAVYVAEEPAHVILKGNPSIKKIIWAKNARILIPKYIQCVKYINIFQHTPWEYSEILL